MNYKLTLIVMLIVECTTAQPPRVNQFEFDCDNFLPLMNFLYNRRCVQLIFGHKRYSDDCIARIMDNTRNVTFYLRSMSWLLNRNIFVEESPSNIIYGTSTKYCENFFIFLQDVSALQDFLKTAKRNVSVATLFPYSKLYFMLIDKRYQYTQSEITTLTKYFYENSQFGYLYEVDAITKKMKLRDLLSFRFVESNQSIQTNLMHPFVDRENNQKEFRISFHDYFPYIIYVDEENLRFDGTDYQLAQQVIKNWNVSYIMRDESKTSISPYITMFGDLANHTADLACAIWLTMEYEHKYDLSTFHSHECITLLVPKPKPLSQITAIYTTLSVEVWLAFGFCFFSIGILMWTSARIEIVERNVYANFSRTFLELMNIATSHGVGHFPRQHSINVLLTSWTILSLLIGICYTTMYTSRLASPGYTKLIDTIEDFIENDMFWARYGPDDLNDFGFNVSVKPAYRELIGRIRFFKDQNETTTGLESGKYGVYGGLTNNKYLVTYDFPVSVLTSFRMMKKNCMFNYYSVFALQKFSPYTQLFSDQALKFREHGFSKYWHSVTYREKRWFNTFIEDYPKKRYERKPINMASISAALLILFVCHMLSLLMFVGELMYHQM